MLYLVEETIARRISNASLPRAREEADAWRTNQRVKHARGADGKTRNSAATFLHGALVCSMNTSTTKIELKWNPGKPSVALLSQTTRPCSF
jgi:hypothetical protein